MDLQPHKHVSKRSLGDTRSIGLNVSKISGMSHFISGGAMGVAVRIVVWTGRHASIGKISEFVARKDESELHPNSNIITLHVKPVQARGKASYTV